MWVAIVVGIGPTLVGVAQLVAVVLHSRRDARNHARARAMIEENTEISRGAFHEANTVNVKLESLGLAHNEAAEAQAAVLERLLARIEKGDG